MSTDFQSPRVISTPQSVGVVDASQGWVRRPSGSGLPKKTLQTEQSQTPSSAESGIIDKLKSIVDGTTPLFQTLSQSFNHLLNDKSVENLSEDGTPITSVSSLLSMLHQSFMSLWKNVSIWNVLIGLVLALVFTAIPEKSDSLNNPPTVGSSYSLSSSSNSNPSVIDTINHDHSSSSITNDMTSNRHRNSEDSLYRADEVQMAHDSTAKVNPNDYSDEKVHRHTHELRSFLQDFDKTTDAKLVDSDAQSALKRQHNVVLSISNSLANYTGDYFDYNVFQISQESCLNGKSDDTDNDEIVSKNGTNNTTMVKTQNWESKEQSKTTVVRAKDIELLIHHLNEMRSLLQSAETSVNQTTLQLIAAIVRFQRNFERYSLLMPEFNLKMNSLRNQSLVQSVTDKQHRITQLKFEKTQFHSDEVLPLDDAVKKAESKLRDTEKKLDYDLRPKLSDLERDLLNERNTLHSFEQSLSELQKALDNDKGPTLESLKREVEQSEYELMMLTEELNTKDTGDLEKVKMEEKSLKQSTDEREWILGELIKVNQTRDHFYEQECPMEQRKLQDSIDELNSDLSRMNQDDGPVRAHTVEDSTNAVSKAWKVVRQSKEQEMTAKQTALNKLREECGNRKEWSANHTRQVKEVKSELDEMQTSLSVIQTQRLKIEDEMISLKKKIERKQNVELSDLKRDLIGVEAAVHSLNEQITLKNQSVKNTKDKIKEMERLMESINKEIFQKESTLPSIKEELQKSVEIRKDRMMNFQRMGEEVLRLKQETLEEMQQQRQLIDYELNNRRLSLINLFDSIHVDFDLIQNTLMKRLNESRSTLAKLQCRFQKIILFKL